MLSISNLSGMWGGGFPGAQMRGTWGTRRVSQMSAAPVRNPSGVKTPRASCRVRHATQRVPRSCPDTGSTRLDNRAVF